MSCTILFSQINVLSNIPHSINTIVIFTFIATVGYPSSHIIATIRKQIATELSGLSFVGSPFWFCYLHNSFYKHNSVCVLIEKLTIEIFFAKNSIFSSCY